MLSSSWPERRGSARGDSRGVDEGRVVVADLSQVRARGRVGRRRAVDYSDQLLLRSIPRDVERAVAALVRRNLRAAVPVAVRVFVEVIAGENCRIHPRAIESGDDALRSDRPNRGECGENGGDEQGG